MERQGKIKSIQKKLESHKKLMEIRMDRFKLKQSVTMLSLSYKIVKKTSIKMPPAIVAFSKN